MKTYTATAITLTVRKYKGSERIATFYSRERGKIEAVAKGIGKPGSTLAPAVEMFALSKLLLAEGRELDRLSQCEVVDSFYELREDMTRFGYASYAAELVARTTEVGEANEELFDALIETLQAMRTSGEPEVISWAFALRLLDMLGFAPALDACLNCAGEPGMRAGYSPREGGIVCGKCRGALEAGLDIGLATLATIRALQTFPVAQLSRIKANPQTAREVRRLLQMHIGYHLGLELKSQAFLEKMGAR
jgi:DNA repair protein RecO (recombination protein O)